LRLICFEQLAVVTGCDRRNEQTFTKHRNSLKKREKNETFAEPESYTIMTEREQEERAYAAETEWQDRD
jgi:hypothetical protein